MRIALFDEPELQFGAGRHIDIRFGITDYGPLDFDTPGSPRHINVGLVGTPETVEGMQTWISKCRNGIPAKESRQPNLFPPFPGCSAELGLRTVFEVPTNLIRTISKSQIEKLVKVSCGSELVEEAVELFVAEMRLLCQDFPGVQVVVCALPMDLYLAMEALRSDELEDEDSFDLKAANLDFHHLLKSRAMETRTPVQIVLPMTYDESKRRLIRTRTDSVRRLQDEATRAWNLHTALYYKAGGVPWRMIRDNSQLDTCYVGVSFYQALDKSAVMTSIAQVFNERGEGVIVRGGAAQISKEDRQPHLKLDDARRLLKDALVRYRREHHNPPARVVVHKSSRYDAGEVQGFAEALDEERIELSDLVSIAKSHVKLFRSTGVYPALRGVFVSLRQLFIIT